MQEYESKCNYELYYHGLRNEGMGSDFHVWSQALCNSMHWGVSMNVANYTWIWNDQEFCGDSIQATPFNCYFDKPNVCPPSDTAPHITYSNRFNNCPKYIQNEETRAVFRASAMEYLFSHVSKRIVNETEYVATELFNLTRGGSIPKDMITVHVRWGDKAKEMKLVSAMDYLNAIAAVVKEHSIEHPVIYLVTESSDAVQEITQNLHTVGLSHAVVLSHGFHLFDHQHRDLIPHVHGSIGRANMVSLLLSLESRYFILTTASNWSRVIDELRRNVLEQIHGAGYTKMIDLQHDGDMNNWRK
jgi:hypothetical protein